MNKGENLLLKKHLLMIRAKIEDEVGSAHARDGAPNPCFILLQIIAVISN